MNAMPAPTPIVSAGTTAQPSDGIGAIASRETPAVPIPGANSRSGWIRWLSGAASTRPAIRPTPTSPTRIPNPDWPAFSTRAKNSPTEMTTPAAAKATMTPTIRARTTG